ncbi:DUF4105 domain-containing protein [Deltaproteobacteria bacterium TL4]
MEQKQLFHHPYWLRLLHYRQPFETPGRWSLESDLQNTSFFLSKEGKTDAKAELKATLEALFSDLREPPETHAQCRYIARFHWLKTQLDFSNTKLPAIPCTLFHRWLDLNQIRSISLVFVSAYMDNPASIFGHPLLKINLSDRFFGHPLLSPTLNFGALIDPSENPLTYAIKGLFGGYQGRFSDERFYNFNHLYGETELRDIWEYELQLEEQQQQRIIYHTWELLQGDTFAYYFLLDNCASRLTELLEMAWDEPKLTPSFALWRMPISPFYRLIHMKNGNEPLVKSIRLIPSRQRRLQNKVAQLSNRQQALVTEIIQNIAKLQASEFLSLSPVAQAQILDVLIDYYQFLLTEEESTEIRNYKQQVLLLRSQRPVLENEESEAIPLKPPTEATAPTRFRLGAVSNPDFGSALQLGAWTSYHDLIGRTEGHLPNMQLVTADLLLRVTEDQINVEQFTFVDIQALNPNPTGLPGETGWSWGVHASLERQDLSCFPCREFKLLGGIGKAYSLKSTDILFLFLDPFLIAKTASLSQISIGLSPRIGMAYEFSSFWKFSLEGRYLRSGYGPEYKGTEVKMQHRFGNSKSFDVRLEGKYNHGYELVAALHYYWH